MNKSDFESELKELMSSMSEEEIEKAISALNVCKTAVYKKNNQKKGEKARLLATTERHESELYYVGEGRKEGTIKVAGASLLTIHDFDMLGSILPESNDNWWLYGISQVINNRRRCIYDKKTPGKIRPVLIIDEINGDLNTEEAFYINDEKFKLLTSSIAIKTACFEDMCTYSAANYESSILRYSVDGWYAKLIRDNDLLKQKMTNAT